MNVIIKISGREAIPVRAIPFLTDWEMMFPDALVDALAGEGIRNAFTGLIAHRRNGDDLKPLAARWWANHIKPGMNALQDRIRASQISDDDGYADWKPGALEVLPEGVFVWKDDYVDRHKRHQARTGVNESLDFCPDIPPMFESLVASGFVDLLTDTAPATSIKASAPVTTNKTGAGGAVSAPLTIIHSTKTRRDALTPVIEIAQSRCRSASDAADVWAQLLVLAENKSAPLIGATEEGLQYLKGGTVEIFTRKSLGKRLTR